MRFAPIRILLPFTSDQPGYYTEENIQCMLKWAEFGVPITLLSMAMGGRFSPGHALGELVVINTDILAWIVLLQALFPG